MRSPPPPLGGGGYPTPCLRAGGRAAGGEDAGYVLTVRGQDPGSWQRGPMYGLMSSSIADWGEKGQREAQHSQD